MEVSSTGLYKGLGFPKNWGFRVWVVGFRVPGS